MERKHIFIANASYNADAKVTGIGIALHQANKPRRNGILIDAIKEGYKGIPRKIIEMFVVYRALEIAKKRSYDVVRVRSDYNAIRTKLEEDHEQQVGFNRNDLHGEILLIARYFRWYSSHTSRDGKIKWRVSLQERLEHQEPNG